LLYFKLLMKFDKFLQRLIIFLFGCLFFLVPIFFTPVNSELFEFNKIILVYLFTVLITGSWIGRMTLAGKFTFKRSFFDIPLVLFLLSQIISTIFSIDIHTSIIGYYSRFNGGLLSTISYILLYWAAVNNCEKENIYKLIKVSLVSATIVSVYGILEHFGHSFSCLLFEGKFNVSCWVQDVQNRVFATLGQPNWLAAYLAVLIPLSWQLTLSSKLKVKSEKLSIKNLLAPLILFVIMFSCLLFTDSRSGFIAIITSGVTFSALLVLAYKEKIKLLLNPFLLLVFSFLFLVFCFNSPFPQINKYFSFNSLKSHFLSQNPASHLKPPTSSTDTQIAAGGTESGVIRKIVWRGALQIFKNYPFFGSGVETFASAYYLFRPVEHNLTSEWDFLYNKAHNEYLNYLATTGLFGLGTYLLFISSIIVWFFIQFKVQSSKLKVIVTSSKFENRNNIDNFVTTGWRDTLHFALFTGWLTLLVTNFFGFSVVITSLYFFLIPAFMIILNQKDDTADNKNQQKSYRPLPKLLLIVLLLATLFLTNKVIGLWRADYYYSKALKFDKAGEYTSGYEQLVKAIQITNDEPVYFNELSSAVASLAYLYKSENDSSSSAELIDNAAKFSDIAVKLGFRNLNVWKTRIKVFYTISTIDGKYLDEAINSAIQAGKLAPTDPKIVYNLGLLYNKKGDNALALKTIEKAIELKPNYADARNALSVYYEDLKKKDKAIEQLEYILKYIDPNSKETKDRLEKLKQ